MQLLICLCLLIISVLPAKSSPLNNAENSTEIPNYRLPETAVPTNYKLELTLAEDVFTTNNFTGILNLQFILTQKTNEIKLHANGITISSHKLKKVSEGTDDEITTSIGIDINTDILTVTSTSELAEGNYELNFEYTATLRTDEMYGFYKSEYIDTNGNPVNLATTQFQATHARKAFPCFDEPSFKATFDITIKHPTKYTAIGNTPGKTNSLENNMTKTIFEQTPIMSTYLVAFIVSDFTCTKGTPIETNLPYQVCSRSEAEPTRSYAVDIGPKILHALEDYTGIKYSEAKINKMDQFAIPDFAAGAMENWGLLTYRETALLWDENESSNRYKQRVATVIAHEMAHMWFGDLVTTHWWSDTFLNEGFATFFEFFITAEVEKDWELDKQFVIEEVQPVLQNDALTNSDPLSLEVSSPTEVSNRFGSISYSKGGAVFRMVEHFMKSDNFKSGISSYLKTHKFKNTTPKKLWTALEKSAQGQLPPNVPLETVMENWVTKAGFPLLQVTSNGDSVIVSQKRFLISNDENNDQTWYVPISYTKSDDLNKFEDTSAKRWLLPNENLTIPDALKEVDWIILNNKQTGYYRINYDDNLWDKIANALNKPDFDGIIALNRAQIVDDLFNLAKIGIHSYAKVFHWNSFLKNDTSYYPWYSAFAAYSNMLQRTGNEKIRTSLSSHILKQMEQLYNTVSFSTIKENDQIYTHTQVLALNWACKLGSDECIKNSTSLFNSYKSTKEKPNKNLRSIIYCNALRSSQNIKDDWNILWTAFKETKISTEQVTILTALGCAKDKEILHDYLSKSIDATSGIRQQDALSVFSAVYNGNPEGVDIALDFFIQKYQEISNYYTSMNSINSLMSGLANRFTNQGQIDKLKNLIEEQDLPESLQTAATDAVTNAENNLKWTTAFEKELTEYFNLGDDDENSAGSTRTSVSLLVTAILALSYQLLF